MPNTRLTLLVTEIRQSYAHNIGITIKKC